MERKWQARNHSGLFGRKNLCLPCRALKQSGQKLDKDEIIEIVNYPLNETLEMIEQGQINDAVTILALQRAWFYLQK